MRESSTRQLAVTIGVLGVVGLLFLAALSATQPAVELDAATSKAGVTTVCSVSRFPNANA